MKRMLQSFFEFFQRGSFVKALELQAALKQNQTEYFRRDALQYARTMEQIRGRFLSLGNHKKTHKEVRVNDLFAHVLIQGRSGTGKSRHVESIIAQVLRNFPEVGLWMVDGKGELFERTLIRIRNLIEKMNGADRKRFIDRLLIIDLFNVFTLPPLNLCVSRSGYPADAATEDILSGLRLLFTDHKLTIPMELVLRNTLIALIEAGVEDTALSLLEVTEFLSDEAFRERVMLRVKNEEVKVYFRRDFPSESQATVRAVKGRLSYLLLSDQFRLCLGAGDCVDFTQALNEGKIVLINLGKSVLATDKAREVAGTMLFSALVRAVFSRRMNEGPNILAFLDEFQNFCLPGIFERIFTEARAFRFFVTACNQQITAQLGSHALRNIILNNVRYIGLFSSIEDDARLLGRVMFKPTGYMPRPKNLFSATERAAFYTEAEELERYIRRIPSLPKRNYYLWDKESPFGAQLVTTAFVPDLKLKDDSSDCLEGRIGQKKEERRTVMQERRKAWGLPLGDRPSPPLSSSLDTVEVLKKLENHLGKVRKPKRSV